MYKIQTNFFGGDTTMIDDVFEVTTYEEALNFVMNNTPPDEYEWDVRKDGKGCALIWTRIDSKVVVLRALQN